MVEEKKGEDYLFVLKSLNEIPFSVGKNLLIDFLKGRMKNKSITKHNLFNLYNFGILSSRNDGEIRGMIENLIINGMIDSSNLPNSFIKVLTITSKGNRELLEPSLNKNKLENKTNLEFSEISEEERVLFQELDSILKKFNDFQKKQ